MFDVSDGIEGTSNHPHFDSGPESDNIDAKTGSTKSSGDEL